MGQQALRIAIARFLVSWLRPYQLAWIQDRARQKAGNWCRQSGKSEIIALEAVLQGLEAPETPDKTVLMVSASEKQAREIMVKAMRWAKLIDDIAKKVAGVSVFKPGTIPTTEKIHLFNDVRVMSLSSNPNTLAGYHGDVFWDEAAKTPRDGLVWDAIHPIISSHENYRLRVTSTPWGDQGKFYEIMKKELPDWSRHELNIIDAVRQGAPHDVRFLRGQYDGITWAQNYLCQFLSGLTSAFKMELLKEACALYESLGPSPKAATRITLGLDIGRVNDRSALVETHEFPEGMYRIENVVMWHRVPFAIQERRVKEILATGKVARLWVDATGIGAQMAENLQSEFPAIVVPITFTNAAKLDMVNSFQAHLERGTLAIRNNNDLLTDLSAIRAKYLSASKTVRYDSERSETGHADSAWGAMLSLGAATGAQAWRIGGVEDMGQVAPSMASSSGGLDIIGGIHESVPTMASMGLLSQEEELALLEEDAELWRAIHGGG